MSKRENRGLGRMPAPDDKHLRLFSLTPELMPTNPESLVVGLDWTHSFDNPVQKTGPDGQPEWWVGLDANNLGAVRGGHCVCIPYDIAKDPAWAYLWYNQGADGVCVSTGCSRRQSIANQERYAWLPLFDWAVKNDGLADTNTRADGTTVRAGLECLRTLGAWPTTRKTKWTDPDPNDGIDTYVWARTVVDMHTVTRNPLYQSRGAHPFLNSWGRNYPHVVWVPDETWNELLFKRGGDCGLATDKAAT